jgi:pimeloyl-ACP methyl ester carboxylesterase
LGTTYPSRAAFFELAKRLPMYAPWPPWERLFDYELADVDGGVRARTSRDAAWEDEAYRKTQDPYALWAAVTMPSLLVRAKQEVLPGMGYILNEADAERFVSEVSDSKLVEVDASHYGIGMHPDTARAIAEFLS